VDCENGPLCSRETEKTLFRLICGVKYPIPGSKRSFSKKNVHFPPPDHCAPVITKFDMSQGDTKKRFSEIATLETGYMAQKVLFRPF
jgi:hypothetical protein